MLTQEKPQTTVKVAEKVTEALRPALVERFTTEDAPAWLSRGLHLQMINVSPAAGRASLNLEIQVGQTTAVVTEPPAGEQFSRAVLGLQAPAQGEILLNRRRLAELSHDELAHWRQHVAGWFTAKAICWPMLSLHDNLMLAGNATNSDHTTQLLHEASLTTHAHQAYGTLSGEQRCLGRLLNVLAKRPKLLLYEHFNLECPLSPEIRGVVARLLANFQAEGGTLVWLGSATEYQLWTLENYLAANHTALYL